MARLMSTGRDNILTAVNVAKSCGMVGFGEKVIFVNATPHTAQSMPTLKFSLEDGGDQSSAAIINQGLYQSGFNYHLAINGKSFAALCDHFPEYLPKVLLHATVFARMAPDQKTQLVKELQKINYRTGMCGDGANDCGALRAADLCAAAHQRGPMFSRPRHSFSLLRYMALYSLVQFCSVLILYTVRTNFSDWQFLFFDMFVVTALAIFMGNGGPSKELQACRPSASLLSLPILGSLFIHTCMIILGQLAAFFITTKEDWYVPLNSTVPGASNLPNMENTSVFALSGFQYIIMAVVVTKGFPHRKPIYNNRIFLSVWCCLP
ncbi:hypothetical protein KUCAC02_012058 [Chaenocephalus aceratus]|uniref:Uncharacterized protein n=1 Tax=Chaenocephalus aceratus TaxID=36190 RepID=A0ACB9X9E1_CHAAC|nr:hypothetical protein KUCAC02_012058 [Chaenocephalus aceratus]